MTSLHRNVDSVPLLDWHESSTDTSRPLVVTGGKCSTAGHGATDLPRRVSLRRLGRWLRDPDVSMRIDACRWILARQRRQAWRVIPLLGDRDRSVRQAARRVLAQLGTGDLRALLLRSFVTQPARTEQRLLLRWAARPENKGSLVLLADLVTRVSRAVRARLIRFLLRHPVAELAEQLAEWSIAASERLLDEYPEARDSSDAFVAQQSEVERLETLASVMELRRPECFSLQRLNAAIASPDPRIRACAVLVMSEYVDFARALPVLRVLVLDRAEGVRDAVLTTLESGRCSDRELLRLLRSDPCPDLRRRARLLLDEVA